MKMKIYQNVWDMANNARKETYVLNTCIRREVNSIIET